MGDGNVGAITFAIEAGVDLLDADAAPAAGL